MTSAPHSRVRRVVAEALGTGLLTATVVGSGVMGERLAAGNVAVALLANTLATVFVLAVLIALLAPVSGAHFNPAVTLAAMWRRRFSPSDGALYVLAQGAGACAGTVLAHAMFALPLVAASTHVRSGAAQWLAEAVATFGLLGVVFGHRRPQDAPWMVAGWIGAAYWFTASTSFANPAVTLGRCLTDSFAGIRPADVPGFIAAQLAGAALAVWLLPWLLAPAADAQAD
jgi:glycerol uptake facilitator-like aquaporin